VQGVNLFVQIGDGGLVNGGTLTTPSITNLDVVGGGTIFNSSNTGTGNTPLYVSESDQPPYMMAMAETSAPRGSGVEANGVLGWLTVNPDGAALGAYRVNLQDVGGNLADTPFTTDFAGTPASFPANDGWIQIVSLHDMKWNAASNGNWTDASWSSSAPPVPNYTANAVVDTPYMVHVGSAEEANAVALSKGGKLSIDSSGSLAVSSDVTVASGSSLHVEGTLKAQALTLNDTLTLTNGGQATFSNITGTGSLAVGNSSTLTAESINVDSLTIGSASSVNASFGNLLPAEANQVPEPSMLALLFCGFVASFFAIMNARRR
jgi:hypothetical protein